MAYNKFAGVYDRLMSDCPYDKWIDFILTKAGDIKEAADGACGTGNIAQRLALKGVKVTAFDISNEMLDLAQEKARKNGLAIRYLQQDLTDFELMHKTELVTVCCDGINYLIGEGELHSCFECANRALNEGGMFIFDISSEYKLRHMDGQMYGDDSEELAYIWNNSIVNDVLELSLSFFCRTNNGLYQRFDEVQFQRAYKYDEIIKTLEETGFGKIEVYDNYTDEPANETSLRLTFCAVKRRRNNG